MMTTYDLMFVFSAVMFNLLIAGIFIAQKRGMAKLVKGLGITWLCLGLPLAVVFTHYLVVGKPGWVLVYFVFILLYMLVELLLDYVLKIDFRGRKITHIPYIILEYVALFGLVGISFEIDTNWGWVVTVCFWILLGSLVYLYRGGRGSKVGSV